MFDTPASPRSHYCTALKQLAIQAFRRVAYLMKRCIAISEGSTTVLQPCISFATRTHASIAAQTDAVQQIAPVRGKKEK